MAFIEHRTPVIGMIVGRKHWEELERKFPKASNGNLIIAGVPVYVDPTAEPMYIQPFQDRKLWELAKKILKRKTG